MCFIIFLIFTSCSENEETIINSVDSTENNINENYLKKEKEFHFHYADWDSWGRTSKSCSGFGLCNYVDCWFCCTEHGVVVDCYDQNRVVNGGEIIIYDETKTGYLTIKLDPTKSEHLNAINNRQTLYIDNNISSVKTTLLKGEYQFDSSVGNFGGYIINALEN